MDDHILPSIILAIIMFLGVARWIPALASFNAAVDVVYESILGALVPLFYLVLMAIVLAA